MVGCDPTPPPSSLSMFLPQCFIPDSPTKDQFLLPKEPNTTFHYVPKFLTLGSPASSVSLVFLVPTRDLSVDLHRPLDVRLSTVFRHPYSVPSVTPDPSILLLEPKVGLLSSLGDSKTPVLSRLNQDGTKEGRLVGKS